MVHAVYDEQNLFFFHFRISSSTLTARNLFHPKRMADLATRYRLDNRGSNPDKGQHFTHLFRPTLGPFHPPIQWVPGHSQG